MAGVLLLVVGFGSSGNLAAAYGISVTGAMAIDAVLAGLVATWLWGWAPPRQWSSAVSSCSTSPTWPPTRSRSPPAAGCRWRSRPGSPPRWSPGAAAAAVRDRLHGHGLTVRGFLDKLDPQLTRVPGTAVF